jgi:hypothetical protein
MIQAIENSYAVPASYLSHKNNLQERAAHQAAKNKIQRCGICDDKGFRHVHSVQYYWEFGKT